MPSLLDFSRQIRKTLHGMAKVADAVILCALVLVLDMAAGILGLAQAARNQKVSNCDAIKWYRFGVAASVLFVAAYMSANISGRWEYYLCPQLKSIRTSMSKRMLAWLHWTSSAVFLAGGLLLIFGTKWCKLLHGHAVGIGAILCFVHSGIIIGFYTPAIVRRYREAEAPQQHP